MNQEHETTSQTPGKSEAAPPPATATIPDNSRFHENDQKSGSQPVHTTQTNSPEPQRLSDRQLHALELILSGESQDYICYRLKIDPKTLYNWKTKNPFFIAELNRRHQELWRETADALRLSVNHAVQVLNRHLNVPGDDMTQLRAARALINLVNSNKLAPANPTRVSDVLDALLRATQPKTPAEPDAPAFSDAQRQTLLDQLMKEDDPAPYPPRKKRAAPTTAPVSGRTEGAQDVPPSQPPASSTPGSPPPHCTPTPATASAP
jgi:hypothetical protein